VSVTVTSCFIPSCIRLHPSNSHSKAVWCMFSCRSFHVQIFTCVRLGMGAVCDCVAGWMCGCFRGLFLVAQIRARHAFRGSREGTTHRLRRRSPPAVFEARREFRKRRRLVSIIRTTHRSRSWSQQKQSPRCSGPLPCSVWRAVCAEKSSLTRGWLGHFVAACDTCAVAPAIVRVSPHRRHHPPTNVPVPVCQTLSTPPRGRAVHGGRLRVAGAVPVFPTPVRGPEGAARNFVQSPQGVCCTAGIFTAWAYQPDQQFPQCPQRACGERGKCQYAQRAPARGVRWVCPQSPAVAAFIPFSTTHAAHFRPSWFHLHAGRCWCKRECECECEWCGCGCGCWCGEVGRG